MAAPILEVSDLRVSYRVDSSRIQAVRGVSFELHEGETLALVGESASGKTSVALAALGLLPPNATRESGEVRYRGRPLPLDDASALRKVRGSEISIIFQGAAAGLTPTLRIGDQVAEVFQTHLGLSHREARARAVETLGRFLPDPQAVADAFAFQLSGGMAQRVMIAMATALEPKVIIADEPTANLDPAVRGTMMSFLENMRDSRGVSVLLITHDFGIVARLADRVAVMYAGELVETADVRATFREPRHPYTYGLLQSLPDLNDSGRRLRVLDGQPPDLAEPPVECAFLARCNKATLQCRTEPAPRLEPLAEGHMAACFNPIAVPLRDAAESR